MDGGEDGNGGSKGGRIGGLGEEAFGEVIGDDGKVIGASKEFEEVFVDADLLLKGLNVLVQVLAIVVWTDVDKSSHTLSVIGMTTEKVNRWEIEIKSTSRTF